MTEAYPLQWPLGWPRTEYPVYSQFRNPTVASARNLILDELNRLGADRVVISSNMALNRDGFPSAQQRRMNDTGVAVYFYLNGEERCIPSDKYVTVEENLHAVGRSIEALRSLERWGTGQIMEAAFRGFKALPANAGESVGVRAWHEVLQVSPNADPDIIKSAYRKLSARYHPDNQETGNVQLYMDVQQAYNEAKK